MLIDDPSVVNLPFENHVTRLSFLDGRRGASGFLTEQHFKDPAFQVVAQTPMFSI